jgi:hypothetical protein
LSYESTVLEDEPESFWRLQETDPPPPVPNFSCSDSGGNGHDGTLNPDSIGGLIQGLDGPIETDLVSYGMSGGIARIPGEGNTSGNLSPAGLTEITLEAWFINQHTGCEVMLSHGGQTAETYLAVNQRSTGIYTDRVVFSLEIAGSDYQVVSGEVTQDEWHHAVGVRSGSFMAVYIDGCLSKSVNNVSTGILTPTAAPWRLGYITNRVFGPVFRSQGLSHAAYYRHALSAERVFVHYQAGKDSIIAPCEATATPGVVRDYCKFVNNDTSA